MPTERVEFIGVGFDRLSREEVLERLRQVTADSPYQYLVTPNVDHVVKLHEPQGRQLLPLFDCADVAVCDSRILRLLARMRGIYLPLVPGSDLTVHLLGEVVQPGDRIAIVGGSSQMQEKLEQIYPGVDFVRYEAPMGLRRKPAERHKAAEFVAAVKARFTLLAVGSPQQEMIAGELRNFADARGTALCIGASLEFITGEQRRAPVWIQRLHLEWAFRLFNQPKRMWRRYLVEGPRIFILAAGYKPKRALPR